MGEIWDKNIFFKLLIKTVNIFRITEKTQKTNNPKQWAAVRTYLIVVCGSGLIRDPPHKSLLSIKVII